MPEAIAVVSAIIALLSAIYARIQNQISLRHDRIDLYRETLAFAAMMANKGPRVSEEQVWNFRGAAELSRVYFPCRVRKKLNAAFDQAVELLGVNDEWKSAKDSNDSKANELNQKRYELARSVRDECFAAAEKMESKLKFSKV